MARIETLTAYKCSFSYLQRNNPLKEELKDKIKAELLPDYTFDNFIDDFCKFTSSLVIGKVTERAILLPEENIHPRESKDKIQKWRIVPYAGKQGKPFRIIKTSTGKKYDFGSDSAALYEHNLFMYQNGDSTIAIFHRQSGSGCKSVFLEVSNKMLREKGMRMDMELYLPLVNSNDNDIQPTKIQLQYVRSGDTSDAAENMRKKKRVEVIQELGLNLESKENNAIKNILQDMRIGKIRREIAFAKIKENCPNADIYNDAEISLRIGKRQQKIRWGEFDSLLGSYDITNRLHNMFKVSGDFISALTELTDEYYDSIINEVNADE